MPFSLSPERQVQRLKNQIGWITRLSAALSSTMEMEDLISLVLSGIISPTGLGYSQVIFFELDSQQSLLQGRYALKHESREKYDELAKELEEETWYVRERHESQEEVALPADDEEELLWLAENSQWITMSQRFPLNNPFTETVQKLSFHTEQWRRSTKRGLIFENAERWRGARAMNKTRLGEKVPESLAPLLPENFAVAPLFSHNGLRGIFVVDCHLHADEVLCFEHLEELDWFARQASLALENMEVNTDLKGAYSDIKSLDQLKSNFLSVISHELRTPLTAMTGFIDLILDERVGQVNENQRTLLNRVAKNTLHLSHLVNDLIEVAQIQAEGTIEVVLRPIEPLAVLMDTIPKLEQRRRETDVQVQPVVDCELPRIISDERALGRIFFHLLDNAMKFSPSGATVEVHFKIVDKEFYVEVRDQGVGISRQHMRHIFDYFYQADNTLTRGYEGLGLGLAVTDILLQATRGRILVESEEGKGSTFTVVFPVTG